MPARKFEAVVLGATGYTGRLVTKYLAQSNTFSSWAVAGRSKDRLETLKKDVSCGAEVGTLVADTSKPETMDELCKSATCVIACAGPFDLVGMPVVAACVRNSTHYVDITGETTFVRKAIESFHEEAKAKGVFIVPCCGFDSIPSEIANLVVHEYAKNELKTHVTQVKSFFRVKGGVSGGTMASIANILESVQKEDRSPVSLNPADMRKGIVCPKTTGVSYDKVMRMYAYPFVMAATNEKIARRSNALFRRPTATYTEMSGTHGFFSAFITTLILYVFGISMVLRPVRQLLVKYVFPAPGGGPSDATLEKGKFNVDVVGQTVDGKTLIGKVAMQKDPYWNTGVMIAQAAACVVYDLDGESPVSACGLKGGVLTPASAFGMKLVERCRTAGMSVDCKLQSNL